MTYDTEDDLSDAQVFGDGFVVAKSVVEKPVQWLWKNHVPLGALTMVDGDPGIGKSTLVMDLAARVSSGRLMPCGTSLAAPSRVVVLSAEDDTSRVLVPRLRAAGANLENVSIATAHFPLDVDGIELIRERIVQTGATLVTIDPIGAYMPPAVDANSESKVRQCLTPLSKMLEEHQVALIAVRHLNKKNEGPMMYRGLGSIGFVGAARAGFALVPHPELPDHNLLCCIKSNLGPKPRTWIVRIKTTDNSTRTEWIGQCDISADQMHAHSHPSKLADAMEFLSNALANGPALATDVEAAARLAQISGPTLQRAKTELGVRSSRRGFQGPWQWSLGGGELITIGESPLSFNDDQDPPLEKNDSTEALADSGASS